MEQQKASSKYLKVLIVVLAAVVVAGLAYFVYGFSKSGSGAKTASPGPSATARGGAGCTPDILSDEETALFDGGRTINNATYHFSYKMLTEWQSALTDNDQMASYANWPWGDESLAAINLMVLAGEAKVAEFPVGPLVEKTSRTVNIDCINAKYTVYEHTFNERWEKDEYHIRTTFTKDGIPYLIILNYPFQGASADGDVVDAYNAVLKTINFE